jgi:hypothetical protein
MCGVDDEHRFIEQVPSGSLCSIALTTGYVDYWSVHESFGLN